MFWQVKYDRMLHLTYLDYNRPNSSISPESDAAPCLTNSEVDKIATPSQLYKFITCILINEGTILMSDQYHDIDTISHDLIPKIEMTSQLMHIQTFIIL
jgi:hypothetical protein